MECYIDISNDFEDVIVLESIFNMLCFERCLQDGVSVVSISSLWFLLPSLSLPLHQPDRLPDFSHTCTCQGHGALRSLHLLALLGQSPHRQTAHDRALAISKSLHRLSSRADLLDCSIWNFSPCLAPHPPANRHVSEYRVLSYWFLVALLQLKCDLDRQFCLFCSSRIPRPRGKAPGHINKQCKQS